jgi:Protein of unknown function (DUF1275)
MWWQRFGLVVHTCAVGRSGTGPAVSNISRSGASGPAAPAAGVVTIVPFRNGAVVINTPYTLRFAVLLTVVNSFLDAHTYLVRGGVFANVQTGNVIFCYSLV